MGINTHGMVIGFGKHKGELYTRVPVSYLFWMVNVEHQDAATAQAEIDRRGSHPDRGNQRTRDRQCLDPHLGSRARRTLGRVRGCMRGSPGRSRRSSMGLRRSEKPDMDRGT